MKIAIRTVLVMALLIQIIFMVIHFNDPIMQFKHWIMLVFTEIIFQLLVGGYIERMNDEKNKS